MDTVPIATGTEELVFQVVAVFVSVLLTALSAYAKKFLDTNKYAVEYNLNNDKTERVLENAVMYAEEKIKSYAQKEISKRDLAIKYIDQISPEIISEYGSKLEFMLDRKVGQLVDRRNLVKESAKKKQAEG